MDSDSQAPSTFDDLLSLARTGIPPQEEDPIDGETADEAYERYQKTGIVNPFHADTIKRREEHHQSTPLH